MDPRLRYKNIQPVNYELFFEIKQKTKKQTKLFEETISTAAATRQKWKDDQMLRSHQRMWFDTWRKLHVSEMQILNSLSSIYQCEELTSLSPTGNESIPSLKFHLHNIQNDLTLMCVNPTVELCVNLKRWIELNSNGNHVPNPEPIKFLVKNMHVSIKKVNDSLVEEELKCIQEIKKCSILPQKSNKLLPPVGGIPIEAWDWEAPEDFFKADLLANFIHLDASYLTKFEKLNLELINLEQLYQIKMPELEMENFEFIWEVFQNTGFVKRRQHCIDFFLRINQQNTKSDYQSLVDLFEKRSTWKVKMDDLICSWTRLRQELSDRIRVTLADALINVAKYDARCNSMLKQIQICELLSKQVQQWRKEKAELLELEYKANQEKKAIDADQQLKKNMRELNRRSVIKQQLEKRKLINLEAQTAKRKCENERLEQLRIAHDMQRRQDTQRLAELESERLKQQFIARNATIEHRNLKKEQKEARLEIIRQQVRPNLSADQGRVYANTKCWKIKLEQKKCLPEDVEKEELLKFYVTGEHSLHTFSDKQLQNDRRTRLSTALFDAGLLNSNYARNLLAAVPLERPYKKDLTTSEEHAFKRIAE